MRASIQLLFGIAGLFLLSTLTAPPAYGIDSSGGGTTYPYITPTPTPTPDPAIQAPPCRPVAVEPINGAIVHTDGEFIPLRASAFHDPNPPDTPNGTHKASQWKVYTESPILVQGSNAGGVPIVIVLDSGPTSQYLTAFHLPKNLLAAGQRYLWTVRYCDASGDEATQWSPWSIPAGFSLGLPIPTPTPTPDPSLQAPPGQPKALEPINGTIVRTDAEFIPLRASAFHDPNPPETPNGTHKASQWRVFTNYPVIAVYPPPDPTGIILDSGPTSQYLTAFHLPKNLLTAGQTYLWSVRYCDASGSEATQWSPWSIPACFSLGHPIPTPTPTPDPAIQAPPCQPKPIEPRNGAMVRPSGEFIVLRATAFRDPNPPDSPNGRHKASQWLVYTENPLVMRPTTESNNTDPGLSPLPVRQIILDSGPTTQYLTMFLLPKKLLATGKTYFWTVRYCDASGSAATQWSPWSIPACFTTAPVVIKNLKPEKLKVGPAKPGASLYTDRAMPVILRLPQTLWSQHLIGTRSTDARTSGPGTLISFSSDLPVNVIVAYDNRATTLPHWLWSYKPYRPILPILMGYATSTGVVTPAGATNTMIRGGDVSIMPLPPIPPNRIPPGIWNMIVSDRESSVRRLLVKEYPAGQAIGLGNNLPAPGVDTKTTASLRMYGVIVQPQWNWIGPVPQPLPGPRPLDIKSPATTTTRLSPTGVVTATTSRSAPAKNPLAPARRPAPPPRTSVSGGRVQVTR